MAGVAVGVGVCWRAGVSVGAAIKVAVGVGTTVRLVATGSGVGSGVGAAVGSVEAAVGGVDCSPPQARVAIRAARHSVASIAAGPTLENPDRTKFIMRIFRHWDKESQRNFRICAPKFSLAAAVGYNGIPVCV